MAATLDQVRIRTANADEDPLFTTFTEHLITKADPAFLETFHADTITAMAREAFTFLQAAHDGALHVGSYQPGATRHGWTGPYTVLHVALRDRPFLVDSVRAELDRCGVTVHHLLHPIYRVVVNRDGSIAALHKHGDAGVPISFELILVSARDDAAARAALVGNVQRVLTDAILATDDYLAMRSKAREVAGRLRDVRHRAAQGPLRERSEEIEEYAAFLDWLDDDNFVFLGYREYDLREVDGTRALQADADSALGILRNLERSAFRDAVPLGDLSASLRERVTGGRPVTVTKTNATSTVHRPARMDYVGVKKLGDGLHVLGERRFLGLFTSKALSTPVEETPILRRTLRKVLERDDATVGSHDYKEIVTIVGSMPRSELFWSDPAALHRDIRTIMSLAQEHGVKLTLRPDPLGRGLGMMVIMPRERFSGAVRQRIQRHLARRLDADHVDYTLAMSEDESQVRFHFFFVTTRPPESVDVVTLETEVAELSRTYRDRLFALLAERDGPRAATARLAAWFDALPDRYQADVVPREAVLDLDHLDALGMDAVSVDLLPSHAPREGVPAALLKIYHRNASLALSDVMPTLENVGLRVLEQVAYQVEAPGGLHVIDVFRVLDAQGMPLDVTRDRARLVPALERLLQGGVSTDGLNRLVLSVGLTLREVELLRAYQRYYAQIAVASSRAFIGTALAHNPAVAAALLGAFRARHDPNLPGGGTRAAREEATRVADEAVAAALGDVVSLAEDAVLRGLHDLMAATVRSNFYLTDGAIALKIASRRVATMPEPRPLYEIGVSGYGLEGTHLRGGMVARGGIRWSERPDDFRTEILGLMKTQMTKNAVIVPVGSKGGFVVEHAPNDSQALRGYVERQYRTFVDALLSVTDDRVGDEVVPPAGMVIHDGPDPYLVVAADKGTATFSDVANEVAQARGFWLGDAFASGGRHGYDHKREGITARGAWESVARHFGELGVDVHGDPVTVAGVGDMSGDVFGNGMLYSRSLRLLAAFNHVHVFLDPDPDPDASYRERERLFALPRSTWRDYDPSVISAGGGVFDRDAKAIAPSPEVRALLDLDEEVVSGPELVRAVLRMRVDLLWNGGVGTYVKASTERHADVGDAANDAVRVDASALRARVVGEGGNLGFTQRARVEFTLAGGRIDTDAIHNVGGVDMSDREVNLKILLAPIVASGALTEGARNDLLASMTEGVSRRVLADAARQSLALSLAERRAKEDPTLFASLHAYLEERGGLDSTVECLPSARERAVRLAAGQTYLRPELAVLLAYAKMGTYRRLLETDVPSDPALLPLLLEEMPDPLPERYPEAIAAHPLRREIVATVATNLVVDLLGPTFVHRTLRQSGGSPAMILRAGLMALDLLDARPVFAALETNDHVDPETRYAAMRDIVESAEGLVAWLVQEGHAERGLQAVVDGYRAPLRALRDALPGLLAAADKRAMTARRKAYAKRGLGEVLATRIAAFDLLPAAAHTIAVARSTGRDLLEVAARFFALGDRLSLTWLRDQLAGTYGEDAWTHVALSGLVLDLRSVQARLTEVSLHAQPGPGRARVERFLASDEGFLEQYEPAVAALRQDGTVDVASGLVLLRMLQARAERGVRRVS